MKLSRLYTNKPKMFEPIEFKSGLNVIFAQVKEPQSKSASSHNLGKTFLISVIDYALLATPKGKNPLRTKPEVFEGFVFFVEIRTNAGKYLTVRRPYGSKKNSVWVKESEESCEDLNALPEEEWTYVGLGLERAKSIVDDAVLIEVLREKSIRYRKLLAYFLRRQQDYLDVFRISNFQRSKDADWKPYIAHILGFDYDLLARKYEVKDEVDDMASLIGRREAEGQDLTAYGQVLSMVQLEEAQAAELESDLRRFSFSRLEKNATTELVGDIESAISKLNTHRYRLEYELGEIDAAKDAKFGLPLETVAEIYEEVGRELPSLLKRSYEDLIEFQKQLGEGRQARLREARKKIGADIAQVDQQLQKLDERRQQILGALQEQEMFAKFQKLQKQLGKKHDRILELRQELFSLDELESDRRRLARTKVKLEELNSDVRKMTYVEPDRFVAIKKAFAGYFRQVMASNAILLTSINKRDNLDFDVRTLDKRDSKVDTSESEGTSYKKMLCVCYDLAILHSYREEGFYRFVYHDGVFEGLDNRKKVALLELARKLTGSGLQYILTVIDADLPRNSDDDKLLFSKDEIVLALDDSGDSGRLFRRPVF